MEKSVFLVSFIFLVFDSEYSFCQTTRIPDSVQIYQSNSPRHGRHFELFVQYFGDTAFVERCDERITAPGPNYAVYVQPGVKIWPRDDGSILLTMQTEDLWFVDFANIAYPMKTISMDTGILYMCCCGTPYNLTGCNTIISSTMITCEDFESECQRGCLRISMYVRVKTLEDIESFNTSGGGVFLKAKKVFLTQPVDPPDGVLFYQLPDGNLILYEDAIKFGYIFPTPKKE